MSEEAIRFEGVSKSLGGRAVLRDVSFSVGRGECVALVGGNGAGKTTTLKVLLDFQHADAGRVQVFGVDNRDTRARARLAFLPERFAPPHHLSGREFLDFMRRLRGRAADRCALASQLESLELAPEALERPVRSYSKGMAQKLGLIACLGSAQELLVLDEPMSGLDAKARILVRRELKQLHAEGRSLLFTTHSLTDAEALCDRLAILCDGRIAFHDSPRACCERFDADSLEEAYLRCLEEQRVGQPALPGGFDPA